MRTTHNAQRTTHNAQRTTHNAQRTTHNINLNFIIILFSFLFMLTSCQEDPLLPNKNENGTVKNEQNQSILARSAIEDKSLEDQIEYKVDNLYDIANFMNTNKAQVQSYLESILMAAHDSLYPMQFRVRDIFNTLSIDYSSIEDAFDAFTDLDNEYWHPVLIIPYKSTVIANGDYDTTDPYYTIANYDTSSDLETFNVYTEQNNILEPYTGTFNESGAYTYLIHYFDIYSYNSGGSSTGSNPYKLRFNKITVKHHKESWIAGASEVHFKGYKLSTLPTTSGDCGDLMTGSSNCYNYDGNRIKKVRRSNIGDQFTSNYLIHDYNTYQNNDIVFYVVFENDPWPAPKKTAEFNFINGEYRLIKYRSWQGFYDKKQLSMDSNNSYGYPFARGYNVNISSIKYDIQ